jgi:hypothetical protein
MRALALAATLLLACRIAAGQSLTPAQYVRAVGEVASELDRAAHAGAQSDRLAEAALGKIPKHVVIQNPRGGPGVAVDNSQLLQGLGDDIARGKRGITSAAGVLRNLQANLKHQGQPAPADARTVLARVLRRGEFRPSRFAALQLRIIRWIDRILRAIAHLIPSVNVPASTGRLLLILLLIAVGVLVLYLIARLVMSLGPRPGRPKVEAPPSPTVMRPHTAWLAEADAALRAGDHRSALRALHMAALMRLDEAGYIRYVDSRTDGRFVRALRDSGRPEIAEALAALSLVFAVVWYGMAAAGPTEYATAEAQWRQLEALAVA